MQPPALVKPRRLLGPCPAISSFQEALTNTSEAKKRYTGDDLYLRGSQLLATSYAQGVVSLRAFVEVDHVTGFQPLRTAVKLKQDFAHLVDVQICAFAQDPISSTEHGEENRSIISRALDEFRSSIEVIGTTPYVEADDRASRQNIQWAIQTALEYDLHLDLHIEYNLKGENIMDTFNYLVDALIANSWPTESGSRKAVLGHATRLTLAPRHELCSLADRIKSANLPIHFVGLPTSDLFMMGRSASYDNHQAPLSRPCGTLNVPRMIKECGLNACLSANNVGNAFTPYGNGDPLALACWGVGLYHADTVDDAKLLYEAVSTRAMQEIMPTKKGGPHHVPLEKGDPWQPMLLVRNDEFLEVGHGTENVVKVQARPRVAIKDVVWDPPETRLRSVIR